jgi:hypothetical protein
MTRLSVCVATRPSLTSLKPAAKFAVSAIIHDFERASPCILAKGKSLAKYKKKRARELKHDRFRDTTMLLADRMAERVTGRGRQVLYVLVAVIAVAAIGYGVYRWRHKHTEEAQQAMGRAIAIASAEITQTTPTNSKDPFFSTEQERAQRTIDAFQQIAAKYGDPYRTEARYFIARSLLVTDHDKGITELQSLSSGSGEVALLSKFVLAQAKEADNKLDEAATLYTEIARANATIVPPDSANLRLAMVYDKQGKKKEAADLLFNIISANRNAKDKDGKPIPESAASRAASQKLRSIDPARHAQLPTPPVDL